MQILLLVLSLGLKLFGLWFGATALLFWKRPAPIPRRAPRTRFACLIPARNEEAVIAAAVESLRRQRYPAPLFDIYVIPNNCTDGTESAARAAGAGIFRCFERVTCKGDALREAVDWLLPRGYDAFCVFDADNLVHPDFLARMNDALLSGAGAAKGRMAAKNPGDGPIAGCCAVYFALFETFFNRSRANLGLSAKLVGTGFAVHRRVLERLGGWRTETIAEDAELAAQCAAMGERVLWVPEAVTYDEAPLTLRLSLRQRLRWCSGIMSAAERWLPALLASRACPLRRWDMALFLCAPFAQALSPLPAVLWGVWAWQQGGLGTWFAVGAAGLLAGYGALAILAAVLARRAGGCAAGTVWLFPLFMASWLPLQAVSLLHRSRVWRPIPHGRPMSARETVQV